MGLTKSPTRNFYLPQLPPDNEFRVAVQRLEGLGLEGEEDADKDVDVDPSSEAYWSLLYHVANVYGFLLPPFVIHFLMMNEIYFLFSLHIQYTFNF